jgi:CyaY protein
MMDEAIYNQRVAALFRRMLAALDAVDPDVLEADSTGDMLTITAASGEKCIVNTQRAVRQVWVAGKGEGIHFDYREAQGRWVDDKDRGLELLSHVERVLEDISGQQVRF